MRVALPTHSHYVMLRHGNDHFDFLYQYPQLLMREFWGMFLGYCSASLI